MYKRQATIIDPTDHPKKEEYAQLLCELRKKKGMTIEEARKLVVDPLYLGCLIIKADDADGQLAGARNTTGNVLRPALQIIKTTPGITCVSGAMLLLTHAPEYEMCIRDSSSIYRSTAKAFPHFNQTLGTNRKSHTA